MMRRAQGLLTVALLPFALVSTARAADDMATEQASPVRLLQEVASRHHALERREAELDERERSIAEREATLDARLAELEGIRESLETTIAAADGRIAEWEEREGDRIKKLSKMYAEMPPGRAAPLLEQLETDLATHIVSRMKDKDSAAVLSLMSDERALVISRLVARPIPSVSEGPQSGAGGER